MSKRLQVVLDDSEYRDMQKAAKKNGLTVSQYVRAAIAAAQHEQPVYETRHKLAAVREAATYSYPTGDVAQMLGEIERGYSAEP